MGKSERSRSFGETQAHHVGVSTEENCRGSAGTVGEAEGCKEEIGCLDRDRSLASSSTRSATDTNPIRPAEQRYLQEHGSQAYQRLLRRLFDELFLPD